MAKQIISDAGPFIHLAEIGEISLLNKFPLVYTPAAVISEIEQVSAVLIQEIRKWKNLKIIHSQENLGSEVEKTIKALKLHPGEGAVLCLAKKLTPSIVLSDDLNARDACESLGIEVHGTVGIIAYAFHKKWLSLKKAEDALLTLHRKSSLFITSAIIERAIKQLRKHT